MSIDLDWLKLDGSLASHVVDLLNKQLEAVERPSFIGPVHVVSLDFGSSAPDVELVDMKDIYRDFLEGDDDDDDGGPVKVTEGGLNGTAVDEDDGFEWVSRRAGNKSVEVDNPFASSSAPYPTSEPASPRPEESPPNPHPNLQLHLHVNWHSNLRISIQTSLLINYPSPMFMSLPIRLSITGLFFNGEVVVAYEGERKRVHICILDDLDPYGPLGGRRTTGLDTDLNLLLPSIFIESEIGQTDKHVLKNVTRVERFIQDVVRKTLEEELVFPNYHTLVMGQ
ncbi:hypothetical protein AGABI2DRAFT_215739 [Agaricus bisporus var. bisporus H97]|uniref:hypothetical protein n=1 Tax=Agaricus bisporus var. bisporus (strain H97 / ATCC MYA-4626 / FGSC 10389) TaxID=936046 RepID=UPI00029F5519|nr:hypothetical protein AGABI2DRAFT_215739 [Agaricus bisporus var. bisporus H97]EKV49754.1 hypothetical protein AGABI2DRAFT_215739 [Agaricus bisporus var. bisporus H97]